MQEMPVEIPNALQWGQKKDTMAQVEVYRERLRGKTTPPKATRDSRKGRES